MASFVFRGVAPAVIVALAFTSSVSRAHAQPAAAPVATAPPLMVGAAWYPEQWPEQRWPEDLRLMKAAGITMVRVAEFAWSRMEPSDGKFDLDWLERAITLAASYGIVTVIGTPSAAPPAWLTHKYPETLRLKETGLRDSHGGRAQYNFTNPRYRQLARRMAQKLAVRFGKNPNVVAWQICNEYSSLSFDEGTRKVFQAWLKKRYKTLDALNTRWTTNYWSQTYDKWEEIPIPFRIEQHPSLMLDWKRFVSDTWRSYQKNQTDVIREQSKAPITHNFMGWYVGYDHHLVAADLDFASYDAYKGSGRLGPSYGAYHDVVRGFKRKNYWIMETQPAFVNWNDVNSGLDRADARAMAWMAIGHGADVVSYWQWRNALGGQEQYHGSLVAPDGNPRPVYEDIARFARELAQATPALAGTTPVADVAMLTTYDDRWAIEQQKHHKAFDYTEHFRAYHVAIKPLVGAIDAIHTDAPIDRYKLIVAPALHMITDERAAKLKAWVEAGGHLVLGARSGFKNLDNVLLQQRQPGPLAPALGAHVDELYALEKPVSVSGAAGAGEATIWAELLKTDVADAQVLLRYGAANGWLDGQPAVVSRKLGKGSLTYVGAWLDPVLLSQMARTWVNAAGVRSPFAEAPADVEINERRAPNGKSTLVIINFADKPQRLPLPREMHNVLEGTVAGRSVSVAARGVVVLTDR
ncbi:MAG: beta-galactosidase [Deltaproteobacteria bacterium]|nr:beta-galactosidase [Deltaproteobacteria bacterium]